MGYVQRVSKSAITKSTLLPGAHWQKCRGFSLSPPGWAGYWGDDWAKLSTARTCTSGVLAGGLPGRSSQRGFAPWSLMITGFGARADSERAFTVGDAAVARCSTSAACPTTLPLQTAQTQQNRNSVFWQIPTSS